MTVKHPEITVHFGEEGGDAPNVLGLVDRGAQGIDTPEEQVEPFTADATSGGQSWGRGLDAADRGAVQWWEMPPMH